MRYVGLENNQEINQPSAEFQVKFIAYLQRLLVEGDFVATYKFALLHALADVCIEKQVGDDSVILLDDLAEKFVELYWGHSLPYSATDLEAELLRQSTGKQAKLLTELSGFRDQQVRSFSRVKQSADWGKLLSSAKRTLQEGPLWRLQILQRQPVCVLYQHTQSRSVIELNPGIVYCFQRFYDLVTSLAKNHWLQKIRGIAANQQLIGGKGDLDEFLFGSARVSLAKAQPVLLEIQKGCCFYCQRPLLSGKGEVDHFIPWARYPSDLGHNFVLAHSVCNNNKSAHLACQSHADRWHEQNIILHGDVISNELDAYFTCDVKRSVAVVSWAYQLAHQNSASLWVEKNQFMGPVERKNVSAETF
jgi:5-methylcytosine-specific restriction endonuclease McrA